MSIVEAIPFLKSKPRVIFGMIVEGKFVLVAVARSEVVEFRNEILVVFANRHVGHERVVPFETSPANGTFALSVRLSPVVAFGGRHELPGHRIRH